MGMRLSKSGRLLASEPIVLKASNPGVDVFEANLDDVEGLKAAANGVFCVPECWEQYATEVRCRKNLVDHARVQYFCFRSSSVPHFEYKSEIKVTLSRRFQWYAIQFGIPRMCLYFILLSISSQIKPFQEGKRVLASLRSVCFPMAPWFQLRGSN